MHSNQAYHHIFFGSKPATCVNHSLLVIQGYFLSFSIRTSTAITRHTKRNTEHKRKWTWRRDFMTPPRQEVLGAPEFLLSQPLGSPKIMRLGIIVVFFHMGGHFIINLVSHAATPSHPKFKVHFFNNLLPSVPVND